ncbi:hypothetical protein L1987_15879 [Smallanthus sonchifolius]|uniref:Uncharacterized protein n=1 Tax=Smallanthus sonchifolius TaxID=185202 RepID=A0ACB9J6T8_9ASTR|nr:hypothetical protein L1987_15879 [Smallanthus sonchifolius]
MAAGPTGDELARSVSLQLSLSASFRNWASASIKEALENTGVQEDEDELKLAAIERLPTYERSRKEILNQVHATDPPDKKQIIANVLKGFLQLIKVVPSNKKVLKILEDVSGILKPSRMTLLLGPPGSGKTTFMRTLGGVVGKDLRETLDFAARCLGVGTRYDLLVELQGRERVAGITPDPDIDAFMKATSITGQESSLILGLDICADIMVGDEMRRGISGGQKKRVTTGEMLVGPAKLFFMDEISTGLDSSTTYQIVKYMKQMVHIMDATMIISLLQPAPETFELFDDIILLSEGHIVYQGPCANFLAFFEEVGFKCPKRKGVADFLQVVTSRKDQEQYWFKKEEPYRFIYAPEFTQPFTRSQLGQNLYNNLASPHDITKVRPAALVKQKYGISNWDLLKANLAREWLLMKRNAFLYIFKTCQITIMSIIAFSVFFKTTMKSGQLEDGGKYMGALFFSLINMMFNGAAELALTVMRLHVFFKQRDSLFYPEWAFAIPIWLLKIPISVIESVIWIAITYYTTGFAPSAYRFFKQLLAYICVHQMALCLFRFLASIGRMQVIASAFGTFTLLIVFLLGGFIIAKDDIDPWMIWGFYISPMMYGQNAIMINEFLDDRWNAPNPDPRINEPTVGKVLLSSRGMFATNYMFWVCVGALIAYSMIITIFFILALTYLNPLGSSRTVVPNEDEQLKSAEDDQGSTFVEEVMNLVELNSIRNSLVELPGVNGLSTEQRKRLTIAVELVANPSIIFMDEPSLTQGCSYCHANAIVDEKRWSSHLCWTSRSPFSPTRITRIKDGQNPATWMLEVSSSMVESQLGVDFAAIYSQSELYRSQQQDLMNMLGAMYAAVMFLGGTNTSSVQTVVSIERNVFYREKAAGMYSPLPYAFAQVAIEVIYVCIQTLIYSLLLYAMIGFAWSASKFLWFYFFVCMCFIYFTLYGMMLVALTPNYHIAAITMSFFLSFWNLFSGFIIPRTQIPIWWRWYYWGSPVAWTLYGLITSHVGQNENLVEVPGPVRFR